MSVVNDVGTDVDNEREPTWEEAIARFSAAEQVEVTRPHRKITVTYRYADGVFTATSPDITGLRLAGPSLYGTRSLVRQDLERFLDPVVEVIERFPPADPEIRTTSAGRTRFKADSLPGFIALSSSGVARAFISSVRASMGRVRSS